MLDAARTVVEFTRGVNFGQYEGNRMLQLAVERALEILGEAARHVSDATRQAHPEIPWRRVVGLRHILAHDYGEIRQERLWSVATDRLPDLIAKIEPLVPSRPREPEGSR